MKKWIMIAALIVLTLTLTATAIWRFTDRY